MKTGVHIDAIVFDLDGTLLDRNEAIRHYCACFFAEHFAWFDETIDPSSALFVMEQLYRVGLSKDARYYCRVLEQLPWTHKPQPDYLDAHYRRCMANFAFPRKDLFETLGKLRQSGVPMAILSNGISAQQRKKIETLQLDRLIDPILISEEIGAAKPSPEAFSILQRETGFNPSRTLFVGDDPIRDISGALLAGFQTAWIRDTTTLWTHSFMPHHQIDDLGQLIPILRSGDADTRKNRQAIPQPCRACLDLVN